MCLSIDLGLIEKLVEKYSSQVDFIDVRIQRVNSLTLGTENGTIKTANYVYREGVGIRVLNRGCWGISSTDTINRENLERAFKEAMSMSKLLSMKSSNPEVKLSVEKAYRDKCEVKMKVKFENVSFESKRNLLLELDNEIRKTDNRIITSRVYYLEGFSSKTYINSEGSLIIQKLPYCFSSMFAIAREGTNIQFYFEVVGGQYGYEVINESNLHEIAQKVAKNAVEMLKAISIKGGEMTVIMDGRVSGTFAHEVFGHAAEADNVINAKSFLKNLVGKKIGSEAVTIVDDATIPHAYGSYFYDDEGVPAKRKVLLEKGMLRGYLHSRETAAIMNTNSTGNGRAQDFSSRIYVRMSNTFIAPGDWTFEEMIEDIKYGVYIEGCKGGMEDPIGGGFQVNALRAWLIEKGELTKLLKSVSISGKALDILKNIDAVGKDFVLEPGTCGKGYSGDMVPVTTGGPHVRVKKMLVGLAR